MERWQGKIAVVTGASCGIGAATAIELTKAGMIVVGLARRVEKIDALKSELPENVRNNLHAMKCDVSKEEEIVSTFQKIDEQFGGISVLVNNAGIVTNGNLLNRDDIDSIRKVMDVNVYGVVHCTREAYLSMQKHDINDGHIVNINSVVGHQIQYYPSTDFEYSIYPPTKYAVTALTEVYRQKLIKLKTKIKVTSISPGLVNTEILGVETMKKFIEQTAYLNSKDIADAVVYVIGTPPNVQVQELIIKPVGAEY